MLLVDARRAILVAGILAIAFAALALDRGSAAEATGLFWEAAARDWRPPAGSALLFYGRVPLVIGASSVVFLAPGLLLALAAGAGDGAGWWITAASLTSLVLSVLVTFGLATVSAIGLSGGAFLAAWALVTLAALATLVARMRRRPLPWPIRERSDRIALTMTVVVPCAFVIACLPKFLWASFNGDGVEAFFASRLLLEQPLPFPGLEAGPYGWFPTLDAMIFPYPASWYVRLLGANELAVRLPFLPGMAALYAALTAHFAARRRCEPALQGAIALAVVSFALILAYSATQNPYFAEPASPAPLWFFLTAALLGLGLAYDRGERGWMALLTAIMVLMSPVGGGLAVLWLVGSAAFGRPRRIAALLAVALTLILCRVFVGNGAEWLTALGLPAPHGAGYDAEEVWRRLRIVQFEDWTRLRYLLVPAGLVPGLALLDWHRLDAGARVLSLVTLGYFALFYLEAASSVHHFAPAMILPAAVLAGSQRLRPGAGGTALRVAWATGLLLALWLALPDNSGLTAEPRRIAEGIEDRATAYASSAPGALPAAKLLQPLFALPWHREVPEQLYGVPALVNLHYACRGTACGERRRYLLAEERDLRAHEGGGPTVAAAGGLVVRVLDPDAWERDRTTLLPSPAGSRFYALPRGSIFLGEPGGPRTFDLGSLLSGSP